MANEFIARKGFISLDGAQVTGSLSVTGNISASIFSGSFVGNGSQLTGVSAGFPFTGSAGITGSLVVVGPVNATSFTGSLQGIATSASYVQLTNVNGFTAYSASINTTITPQTATVNTGSSPLTLTTQSIVVADSTNGNLIINLPDLNTVIGTPNQKPIVVYKNDYSQNVIYVNPSGSQLVNGASQDIIVSIQLAVIYNPTSAGWVTEGTSAQSLAELELFFLSLTETGSLATTGSNVFIGNQIVTGSLTVTGNITGNITGSATSASYVEYTNVANKPTLVSGSAQVTYSGLTGVPSGIVSGSSQVTYSGLTGIPAGIVSSSAQVGEYGIFATTGSNQFNGSQAVTGSLTVTGQVVAQTLNVQQVTSSIVYSSGSNIFGNSLGNTQQFTGSVSVTGSLTSNGALTGTNATFTGTALLGGATATNPLSIRTANGESYLRFLNADGSSYGDLERSITGAGAVRFTGANFRFTAGAEVVGALTGSIATFSSNVLLSGTNSQLLQTINNSIAGDNAAVFYNSNANSYGLYIGAGSGTNHALYITDSTRTKNLFKVEGNGNVGIGTASPASLLQVYGLGVTAANAVIQVTGTTNYAAYRMNNSGGDFYIGIENSSGTGFGTTAYGRVIFADGAYPLIVFTAGVERLRITSGGIVSINGGLTTYHQVSIKSNSTNSYGGLAVYPTSGDRFINVQHTGTQGFIEVDFAGSSGFSDLGFKTGGSSRMTITSGGDVLVAKTSADGTVVGVELRAIGLGIFTRSGGSCLQLNRNTSDGTIASFRTSDVERGSISIAGATTSYNTSSDYRLKEDLKEIKGLEKLSALKVYDFKWKSDQSRMDGVLAHELAEVLPYAVHGEKDGEEMQGVDYSKLIPVLVKAIQEQQSQIESLKAEIQTLKQ